jgi:hypothetical protein
MDRAALRRSNILGGGYCARIDLGTAGQVLRARGWARHGEFSGFRRAGSRAPASSWAARSGWIVLPGSNGGFPPFLGRAESCVPSGSVPSETQGIENTAENRVSRQIDGLTTAADREATGGVGPRAPAGEGGFAPLDRAAGSDTPPSARETGRKATFRPCRLHALPLRGAARRSIDATGVGGIHRARKTALTGGRGSGLVSGQGASASRESGGNAKDGTMRRGGARVN